MFKKLFGFSILGLLILSVMFSGCANLWDADLDTGIQIEKTTDDDIIRFDVAGSEVITINGSSVNFKQLEAVQLVVDNGDTLPTSPVDGQWFLHTKDYRTILYQYFDSVWNPLTSYGTMNLYVHTDSGTDDLEHGDSGYPYTNCFATAQYAVDCIPPNYDGDVLISVRGTTTDDVTVSGKYSRNDSTITFSGQGICFNDVMDSGTQGSGANWGTITDANQFTGDEGKILGYGGEYKVINSTTANTATVVGYWASAPSGGYSMCGFPSGTIDTLTVDCEAKVEAEWCTFDNILMKPYSYLTLEICKVNNSSGNGIQNQGATLYAYDCYFISSSGSTVLSWDLGSMFLYDCKIENTTQYGKCVALYYDSYGVVNTCYLDQDASPDGDGQCLYLFGNSSVNCSGYSYYVDSNHGIEINTGSQAFWYSQVQFSGNDENIHSDASTFVADPIPGEILRVSNTSGSCFYGLIDNNAGAHGGQGLDSTHVPYDNDTYENMFNGLYAYDGSNYWGQIVLHNTTKGESCKIVSADLTNNVLTVTANSPDDVSSWSDNDNITTESQTNLGTSLEFYDVDLSDSIPETATSIVLFIAMNNNGIYHTSNNCFLHPYETFDQGKRAWISAALVNEKATGTIILPVKDQKITICIHKGGAEDFYMVFSAKGYWKYAGLG